MSEIVLVRTNTVARRKKDPEFLAVFEGEFYGRKCRLSIWDDNEESLEGCIPLVFDMPLILKIENEQSTLDEFSDNGEDEKFREERRKRAKEAEQA